MSTLLPKFSTFIPRLFPYAMTSRYFCSGTNEAITICRFAKKIERSDKIRAKRLFQHAVNCSPQDSSILKAYGNYLENNGDFLSANQMYCKAYHYKPEDADLESLKIKMNSVVSSLETKTLQNVENDKNVLRSRTENLSEIAKCEEEELHEFSYHTLSIEGIDPVPYKIRNMKETCRYAYNNLGINDDLSVKLLLKCHKMILGDHSGAGRFRDVPVFVNGQPTPDPEDLEKRIEDFLQLYRDCRQNNIHAIRFAATIHFHLVAIHPFIDGNGRMGRLLMATILRQHGYPYVTIPTYEIEEYYEGIRLAHFDDFYTSTFYIAKCAKRSIENILSKST